MNFRWLGDGQPFDPYVAWMRLRPIVDVGWCEGEAQAGWYMSRGRNTRHARVYASLFTPAAYSISQTGFFCVCGRADMYAHYNLRSVRGCFLTA